MSIEPHSTMHAPTDNEALANIKALANTEAQALLDFIDASPSPWHAVGSVSAVLNAHGFKPLIENQPWQFKAGGRYYVVRDGASIIAFVLGQLPLAAAGMRIVGAHTDSPGLRKASRYW